MPIRYEDRSLSDLKKLAKSRGLSGYYKLRKEELIKLLRGNRKIKIPISPRKSKSRILKFEKCISKVKKNSKIDNPYGICIKSIYK
jgi:hypothetical protein